MSATRAVTRSTSAETPSIEESMEMIEQLARRNRNASRGGGADKESTPTESVSTPIVEETPSSLPGSRDEDAVNPEAVKLWNQMFETRNYVALAGRDFFHTRVKTLVTLGQVQKITAQIEKDIRDRKVDYIKSKETDTAKLRLSLQELFTKVVIRRALSELAQCKADAIARREYLTNLDDQAVEKYRTQQSKVTEKNERVKAAQDGIINLLKFVEEQLGKDADQIHLVGSTEHTMELIKDFLNKALVRKSFISSMVCSVDPTRCI